MNRHRKYHIVPGSADRPAVALLAVAMLFIVAAPAGAQEADAPPRQRPADASADSAAPTNPAADSDVQPWWNGREAGLWGGIAGSTIGVVGGVIGILGGLGRARRTVMTLIGLTVAVSALALVTGLVAVVVGQPYAVWYPLVLIGFLGTAIPLFILPGLKARYRQDELRRMQAQDA